MITHLPECPLAQPCRSNGGREHVMQGTIAGFPVTICGMCMDDCICDRLRACEQRVRGMADLMLPDVQDRAYREGYAEALDRAREAVDAIPTSAFDIGIVTKTDVLAAIDALRGGS